MSSVGNPRRNARKRNPPATRRRALELLAGSRDGCTEAIMIAHGFTVEQMVELVRAGFATARVERMVAGKDRIEVAPLRITEAGRKRSQTDEPVPFYPRRPGPLASACARGARHGLDDPAAKVTMLRIA